MTIRPVVIDMNHADASREIERHGKKEIEDLVDYEKAYKFGIRGIIHKVTEGSHFVDPLYKSRRPKALAAGMLWAGYHFMRPGDVGDQASFFLNNALSKDPFDQTLFMLDYEDDKLGLWQAERWLEVIHIATRKRPWLYGGNVLKEQLARRHTPSLAQYPLVLAEYGPVAKVPLPWKNFVLWQRSGDGEGPGIHDIPGIGTKQDINYFDGTDEELKLAWLDNGAGQIGA